MKNEDGPTQVFGLTKAELLPIVEAAAGEPVVSFEVRIAHEVQGPYGAGAEKLVPTFGYVTRGGGRGEAIVFAKRFYEELPGPREAHSTISI